MKVCFFRITLFLLAVLFFSASAFASEFYSKQEKETFSNSLVNFFKEGWNFSGYSGIEYRQFFEEDKYNIANNQNSSFILEPEIYKVVDSTTYTTRVFLRIDDEDERRTHFDIRQMDFVNAKDDFEIKAGFSKVFWGVTESRHLVDIINQTDFVEHPDGESKLGQPLIQFGYFKSWGDLRFFYMPYFREQTFLGKDGRLKGPLNVDKNDAIYTNSAKQWHPDFAVRYKHTIDAFEFGLSHFHGTSREPFLVLSENQNSLIPKYEIIDQTGFDAQYTKDSLLLKLEAIARAGHGDYFAAIVSGFEYTFFNIKKLFDLGLIAEYNFDDRDSQKAPQTIFDNDTFLGARVTLNDVQDTQFLGGVIIDNKNGSKSFSIEATRRLTDNVKIEIKGNFFSEIDKEDTTLFAIEKDDFLQIQINYFF